jgi:AcrR family transcriptional regulator
VSDEGLRERKKRETRRRIHLEALRLAVARGVEAVTVDDIAAAAEVSPRTFFNYFPTKEAALVGAPPDLADRLADAFDDRPADEPPPAALRAVLTEHLVATAAEPELRRHTKRLMVQHPELAVAMAGVSRNLQESLTASVARRVGVDPDVDPYPRLVVAVALAAVGTALAQRRSRHATTSDDMRADLDTVFELLEAGLPQPVLG